MVNGMSKQKKEKRPVISFRVNRELKDKIIEVYGDYTPLEHILEEQLLGKITPPSVISEDGRKIKELETTINNYNNIYLYNLKYIKNIENENKKINDKINNLQDEIVLLKSKNKQIKQNVKESNIKYQEKIDHSVKMVTNILKQNQQEREKRPTKPVDKKVIKLYSDNCNMSLRKFLEHIPPELHKCIQ